MSDFPDPIPLVDEYLAHGGLFNPECMEHNKVRDLLLSLRAELVTSRAKVAELEKELSEVTHLLRDSTTRADAARAELAAEWEKSHKERPTAANYQIHLDKERDAGGAEVADLKARRACDMDELAAAHERAGKAESELRKEQIRKDTDRAEAWSQRDRAANDAAAARAELAAAQANALQYKTFYDGAIIQANENAKLYQTLLTKVQELLK